MAVTLQVKEPLVMPPHLVEECGVGRQAEIVWNDHRDDVLFVGLGAGETWRFVTDAGYEIYVNPRSADLRYIAMGE